MSPGITEADSPSLHHTSGMSSHTHISPARSESEEGDRERIRREREAEFDRETILHLSQLNEELKAELSNEICRSNEIKVMFYALQQQLDDMVELQGTPTVAILGQLE